MENKLRICFTIATIFVIYYVNISSNIFISRRMDERELPSDSDESDEDYVPCGLYRSVV